MPTPEKANSVILVRPISTAPAARKRAIAGASCAAGGVSSSACDPARLCSPAMSNRSLTETGSPAEGRGDIPRFAEPVLRIGRGAGAVGVNLDEGAGAFAVGIGDAGQR